MPKSLISLEVIENEILLIRGQKVILDSTLAKLYGVTTKRLNEQVRRNKHRFPKYFMFQLIFQEVTILRSHFATSSFSWGGRRFLPNVFTEHGVIMAASILNTKRAIEVSVFVVRAFVKLRQMLATHKEMAHKLTELEKRLGTHDDAIRSLFNTIRQMMNPPEEKKQKIGFKVK